MTQEMKILLASLALCGSSVFAQDMLVSETEEILNSERIDIDGTIQRETPAQRVEKMRKRLEAQNEQMVQKKIEDIRITQEKALANKLQKAFKGNMQALDSDTDTQMDEVQTVQAAPQTIIAPAPIIAEREYKNAIIPFFGVKQFDGEDIDSFESDINAGLTFENELAPNFRIGLGVAYTTLGFTDTFFNEDVSMKNLNLNLTGKFIMATESTIRPYLALGVGYNRINLAYDTEFQGDTIEATGNNVTGSGSVGVEFAFAKNLGLNIDFTFARAMTSAFDDDDFVNNGFLSSELLEARLDAYGNALEDSNVASLNIGFLVKF